jgi:hypothetical protein
VQVLLPSLHSIPLTSVNSKALRAIQTAKLAALLKRKLNIEQSMLNCVNKLDEAYRNGARDLQAVAKGRREELERAIAVAVRERSGEGVQKV